MGDICNHFTFFSGTFDFTRSFKIIGEVKQLLGFFFHFAFKFFLWRPCVCFVCSLLAVIVAFNPIKLKKNKSKDDQLYKLNSMNNLNFLDAR